MANLSLDYRSDTPIIRNNPRLIPITIMEIPGRKVFDWTIPQEWELDKQLLRQKMVI